MKRFCSRTDALLLSALLVAAPGCADLNRLDSQLGSVFRDLNAETREAQQTFDRQKAEIESTAFARQISWSEAARQVRELDKSLVGRGRWRFDSNDEEYHAYCLLTAEQLDLGRITYAYYDALRTRRFNEIQARRR